MQVIDEVTRKKIDRRHAFLVVTDLGVIQEGGSNAGVVLGYSTAVECCPPCILPGGAVMRVVKSKLEDKIIYSNLRGIYMAKSALNNEAQRIQKEEGIKGSGSFPYAGHSSIGGGIDRNYEAIESFGKFDGRQKLLKNEPDKLADYLDYTFGIEYETSCGYVPEDLCYRDGLIPLRDGSISGIEYSTVVLHGNEGISAMKQQVETLKKYTLFDKDCSLHIHFGGYPQDPEKLYSLYLGCYGLQNEIAKLVPALTFRSGEYKSSGKDYCKLLPYRNNFNDLYQSMTGRSFYGSLNQPHPNDLTRKRKWQIGTRYFYVNFINSLCYTVNKTIEWRLLRPTYNTDKIILWMYIFNGIMKYCDKHSSEITKVLPEGRRQYPTSLDAVLKDIYSEDIYLKLVDGMRRLEKIRKVQTDHSDFIGSRIDIEDRILAEEMPTTLKPEPEPRPKRSKRRKTPHEAAGVRDEELQEPQAEVNFAEMIRRELGELADDAERAREALIPQEEQLPF